MRFRPEMLKLYAVTDRSCLRGRDLESSVEQAILGGATMIQLREKNVTTDQLAETARGLLRICRRYGVPLIINDDWKAAVMSGADGVHVGAEDDPVAEIRRNVPPEMIVGATAKTVDQARRAEAEGADYLGTGAVFPSPTKSAAIRITPAQLREICGSVNIPVAAIGGITAENVGEIKGCGQRGIAVVSAVFGADDIKAAAERMLTAMGEL